MKNLVKIEPIAVKDKDDVVKALTILEKLGIKRMSEEQKINYLADEEKVVNNNFMIQEDDGGFRIQSHYIGHGISIESLEKQVNKILKKHPKLTEEFEGLKKREGDLKHELDEIKKSYPVIKIKE